MSSAWELWWADKGSKALRARGGRVAIHPRRCFAPLAGCWEPVNSGCDLLQQLGMLRIGLSSSGEKELGSLCVDFRLRQAKRTGTKQCAESSHRIQRALRSKLEEVGWEDDLKDLAKGECRDLHHLTGML